MSARLGRPNNVAISIPNEATALSKAVFVGANTVKVPNGSVKAGSNFASTTAATREVCAGLPIAISATV